MKTEELPEMQDVTMWFCWENKKKIYKTKIIQNIKINFKISMKILEFKNPKNINIRENIWYLSWDFLPDKSQSNFIRWTVFFKSNQNVENHWHNNIQQTDDNWW